jgi:hypothetical protein
MKALPCTGVGDDQRWIWRGVSDLIAWLLHNRYTHTAGHGDHLIPAGLLGAGPETPGAVERDVQAIAT